MAARLRGEAKWLSAPARSQERSTDSAMSASIEQCPLGGAKGVRTDMKDVTLFLTTVNLNITFTLLSSCRTLNSRTEIQFVGSWTMPPLVWQPGVYINMHPTFMLEPDLRLYHD